MQFYINTNSCEMKFLINILDIQKQIIKAETTFHTWISMTDNKVFKKTTANGAFTSVILCM